MNTQANATIHKTSAVAALIAAALSPVPLADELVLPWVYGEMARRIGKAHGLSPLAIPWKPIALTALRGLAARATVNLAVTFVPGIAAVANATSAAVLTELLGRHMTAACETPAQAKTEGLTGLFKTVLSPEQPVPAATTGN